MATAPSRPSANPRASLPREAQRRRILSATIEVGSEHGPESATVTRVVALAGVSRRTFYDLFEDRSDCLRTVFEETVRRARDRAGAGYDPQARWVKRVRAGLRALLEFVEDEPELVRLCLQIALGDSAVFNGRRETLDQLARLVDEGRMATRASRQPTSLAAESVVGGALALICARLIAHDPRSFLELENPLMSMIVLPYLGPGAAQRELRRSLAPRAPAARKREPALDLLGELNLRLTYRTLAVLEVIAAEPGLSNSAVSDRAGITDQGQISKLLKRLVSHGLLKSAGPGQGRGEANAWRLTRKGEQLLGSARPLR